MAAGATVLASAAAVMGSVLRSGQSGRFAMPLRSLSREEVRQVDEKAIAMGLPGVVLMENAALGLTDVVCDELAARDADLRAASKTYRTPHEAGEPFDLAQEYLPSEIRGKRFYDPSGSGAEAFLRDRIAQLRAARTSKGPRTAE